MPNKVNKDNNAYLLNGCSEALDLSAKYPDLVRQLKVFVFLDIGSGSTTVRFKMVGSDEFSEESIEQECGEFSYPNNHQKCINKHEGVFHRNCSEVSIATTIENLNKVGIRCTKAGYSCTAFATAWARSANITEHEQNFKKTTGINFIQANHQLEASLGYQAVKNHYSKDSCFNFKHSVFDIGGGSFQFSYPNIDGSTGTILGKIGSEVFSHELRKSLNISENASLPYHDKSRVLIESQKIVARYLEEANFELGNYFGPAVGIGRFLNFGIREVLLKDSFSQNDLFDFLGRCFAPTGKDACNNLDNFLGRSPEAFVHVVPTNFILLYQLMNLMDISNITLLDVSILDGVSGLLDSSFVSYD